MKKNVLIIIPSLSSGGAERVVANLAEELSKYYNINLVVFDTSKNVYDSNVPIIDLKTKPSDKIYKKMLNYIIRFAKLRKIKKTYNISCSISFLTTPNFLNVISRRKDKVIISIRNKMSINEKSRFSKFINKFSCDRADIVVTLSKSVKFDQHNVYGTNYNKMVVIYNACDVEKIQKEANMMDDINEYEQEIFNSGFIIITAGRLTHQKGQWHLIRAFKKVVDVKPGAKLIILGTGELEGYLKELIIGLELENNVFLLGFSKNPYKYMKKANLFIFTSLYEGFGNILLEAMACELPIISTDCDAGPRELLAPNTEIQSKTKDIEKAEYGILTPVCDGKYYTALDELTEEEELVASSIIMCIDNKETIEYYKKQSKIRIKDFNKEENTKKWLELLN